MTVSASLIADGRNERYWRWHPMIKKIIALVLISAVSAAFVVIVT